MRMIFHRFYYPVNRFLRVLFSVVVCLIAALLVSAFIWSDVEGHYTYRAASPLFLLVFLSPLFLGFIGVSSVVLYSIDREVLRGTRPSFKQSILLLSILAVGSLTGYFSFMLGAVFLFLLFYWIMTGRVAGRAGWSVRGFWQTKWDEKLYLIVMVVLFAPMIGFLTSSVIYKTKPVVLGTPAFQVRREREMNFDVKRALYKFPDAQACLQSGADAAKREDLVRMDWDKIVTNGDAKVCSFRLLYGWGGVGEAESWLEAQGFRVSDSFSSAVPYLDSGETLRVDGHWSIRRNGPRFPTSGVIRRVFSAVPYVMGVRATYSPDGAKLLFIGIDSSSQ